jgi:hypothetical protein
VTTTFGVFLAFLILSLLLPVAMRRNMKTFTMVYFILAAARAAALYLLADSAAHIWWGIGEAVVGYVAVLSLIGIFAGRFNRADYMAIAVAIGFFPWHYSVLASVVYFVIMLVFLGIWGLVATNKGKKAVKEQFNKKVDIRDPRRTLNEDHMKVYLGAFPQVKIELGAFVGAAAAVLTMVG